MFVCAVVDFFLRIAFSLVSLLMVGVPVLLFFAVTSTLLYAGVGTAVDSLRR